MELHFFIHQTQNNYNECHTNIAGTNTKLVLILYNIIF